MYKKLLYFLAVANVLTYIFSKEVVVNPVVSSDAEDHQTTVAPRKWILELTHEAESTFDVHPEVSENCKRDFDVYKLHRKNQTVWAVRMMESSEWPRTGVFSGVTTFLGNWAECLRSRGPGIQGQYCLPEVTYDFAWNTVDQLGPRWVDWPRENESVWQVINSYRTIPLRVSRQKLTWAMCLPASCGADDLENSLIHTLEPIFKAYDLDVSVAVNPETCHVDKTIQYPLGFFYACIFFTLLAIVTVAASLYDLQTSRHRVDQAAYEETRTSVKLLKCFSTLKNWEILTRHTPNTYTVLYTIKFICLVLIIIGHEGQLSMSFPKLEEEQAEMRYRPWNIVFGFHSVVDNFIMVSGFLTFFMGFERSKKYGLVYYIASVIMRWLRLIPVMAVVFVFYIFVMPYVGDGPLWSTRFLNEIRYCHAYWWTNILAINNFIHPEQMCLLSTWYIAVDIQLAILGGALLMILTMNWKIGIAITTLTFLIGVATTFLKIYVNNYSGVPMTVIPVGPYLVGSFLALLVRKLKDKGYTFSQVQSLVLILTSCAVCYGLQLYGLLFFKIARPYDVLENALFGAFQRILFVIPVAVFICTLCTSTVVLVSNMFEFKIFLPLGRLSYCAYLISFPIQLYRFATFRRTLISVSEADMGYQAMAAFGYTIVLALLLFLIAEGPIKNLTDLLQTYLIKRLRSPSKVNPSPGTIDPCFKSSYYGSQKKDDASRFSTLETAG